MAVLQQGDSPEGSLHQASRAARPSAGCHNSRRALSPSSHCFSIFRSPSSAGRSPGRRRPSHPPNLWQEKLGDLAEVAHQRAEEAEQRALAAVEPRMAAVVRAAVAHERLYQKHKEKLKAIELKRAESVKAVYKPHDKIEREFTMVKGSKGGGGFSFGLQSLPQISFFFEC